MATPRATVDKYSLMRLIGRGGMGEVYEAKHIQTGRRVALKLVRIAAGSTESDSKDIVRRFVREGRAMGAVQSNHIVQVLDAGADPDTNEPFMVMEYLDGEDVSRALKRTGPMPVDLAIRIVTQACRGLAKAHEAGIIHRDIKPGNLFLARSDGGTVLLKLLDFGIARYRANDDLGGENTKDLTRTGSMLGSPHYMAPEQARGKKDIDARADVWSLGVVLYKLLTGKTPHEMHDGGLGELLITICCVPAPAIQDRAPWVPPAVAEVIHTALALSPSRRYANAGEMLEALQALMPGGVDMNESMFMPITEEEKARVEERATVGEASATHKSIPAPSESSTRIDMVRGTGTTRTRGGLVGAVSALAVLAVGGGALFFVMKQHDAKGAQQAAANAAITTTLPQSVPTQAPAPADTGSHEQPQVVKVQVNAGATVEVDGENAVVTGDTVSITGVLGSVHQVKVRLPNKQETSGRVVITQNGPMPASVLVQKLGAVAVGAPASAGAATSGAGLKAPATPKKDPGLAKTFE
ncbi:MAG: serine/threonine-protein kinase [Polyangiaceae bacterium]